MLCRLETADFEKNDLYVVRYQTIQEKLRDQYVQLIWLHSGAFWNILLFLKITFFVCLSGKRSIGNLLQFLANRMLKLALTSCPLLSRLQLLKPRAGTLSLIQRSGFADLEDSSLDKMNDRQETSEEFCKKETARGINLIVYTGFFTAAAFCCHKIHGTSCHLEPWKWDRFSYQDGCIYQPSEGRFSITDLQSWICSICKLCRVQLNGCTMPLTKLEWTLPTNLSWQM